MTSFTEIINIYIRPLVFPFIILAIIALFIYVGNWAVSNYYSTAEKKAPFADVANNPNGNRDATVTLYYATWCPACKRAKPEWDAFVEEFNGKEVNGYTIVTNEIDCSKNDSTQIATIIQEHNINGFPTIQMYVDGNTILFDSPVTQSTLGLFVEKML